MAHRSDLNYLISEMIAELSSGHTYVAGGDFNIPERPQGALLGARFKLDAASGRYQIAKIFAGQNDEDNYRSPLTEVGVDVKVGDYLLAVNGEDLKAPQGNPEAFLRRAEGDQVELTVNDQPNTEGARRVVVRPIRERRSADLPRVGRPATANTSPRSRAASSATCTSPTWATTASASSSSGTTARPPRKAW